jgi:hypothetical protein
MRAACQCGRLSAGLPDSAAAVVACHCIACQRRSGSPFGVLAYYPAEQVTIMGEAKRYARPTDAGHSFETFFCTECGSTVYARAATHPALIGIAVGAIADPDFQAPTRSVWEQSMHSWVSLPSGVGHFPKGRVKG